MEEYEKTQLKIGLDEIKISQFTSLDLSPDYDDMIDSCQTTYNCYKLFSTDSWVEDIGYQSKLFRV